MYVWLNEGHVLRACSYLSKYINDRNTMSCMPNTHIPLEWFDPLYCLQHISFEYEGRLIRREPDKTTKITVPQRMIDMGPSYVLSWLMVCNNGCSSAHESRNVWISVV